MTRALVLLCLAALAFSACQRGPAASVSALTTAPSPSTAASPLRSPTPSRAPRPSPTYVSLLRTPPPAEQAIIARANQAVDVLNTRIEAINSALESGSPTKLKTAAKALGKWATSEIAWLKAHPAPECAADPQAKYQDIVEAFQNVSKNFLRLLSETDPENRKFLAEVIQMNWGTAHGSLQMLRTGEIFSHVNC